MAGVEDKKRAVTFAVVQKQFERDVASQGLDGNGP